MKVCITSERVCNPPNVPLKESRKAAYEKLLLFVDSTSHYRVDRLLGVLPSDGTWLSVYAARWQLMYTHRPL
jgi:hypothetical protein